jgi:transcriptional regulator with XRE-family HTH domain
MGFKDYIKHAVSGRVGIGDTLRSKRIAQGLSLFALAHELNLNVSIIEAVEAEEWHRLPKGRERPHTRLIAEHLGVDLNLFLEQWDKLPGSIERITPDRDRRFLDRVLVISIIVFSIILLFWLVVPGPNLKRPIRMAASGHEISLTTPQFWFSKEQVSLYPVAGEVLPEVPVNSDGVIVSMRAMDTCEAVIKQCKNTGTHHHPGTLFEQRHTLLVSEPWCLRVKGPFTIFLENAGVVTIEVAGRRVRHGCTVGESWSGQFGSNGGWYIPADKLQKTYAHTAPEGDQEIVEADQ